MIMTYKRLCSLMFTLLCLFKIYEILWYKISDVNVCDKFKILTYALTYDVMLLVMMKCLLNYDYVKILYFIYYYLTLRYV